MSVPRKSEIVSGALGARIQRVQGVSNKSYIQSKVDKPISQLFMQKANEAKLGKKVKGIHSAARACKPTVDWETLKTT